MTTQSLAYVNGEIVPISEAKISLLDWGFLHSDATYDVAHVWEGHFFHLNEHLDRYYAGMEKLRMSIPYNKAQLTALLLQLVAQSGLRHAYVEMITTRGQPEPGSRDPRTCTNQFFAFVVPFVWISQPDQGLHIAISQQQRIPTESVDPTIKNYHWLDLVMGQFEAYDRGAQTAAVVDANGNIKEGPGFNIFIIKDSQLFTTAEGVLLGITRQTAIQLAQQLGMQVVFGEVSADAFRNADETFATSTAGGIMAITQVDDNVIGDGQIGPLTQQLKDAYWAMHKQPNYATEVVYESEP
ncbi:aminotransferase class IV [Candidatus Njordibacter sp. Uisw_039]|jgi:branched-chain amino acid aminotransferase|uniref:aminotransferase class IV n=1 Tax=Candidatus Njordibacter sp. Uisw_039 TaxID=3230972 RepID=UPI003D3D946D|tara:strand:- start:836 stop:1726 length:891 start_codon:yes stop_codon:yes gene_type:complete